VLKNAIDWASRPRGDNSFENKPVAIMSASTGMLGGARAQYHLRQSLVFLNTFPINKPEIFVSLVAQKFDDKGKLLDQKTGELIGQLLTNLAAWTRQLQTNGQP
jgi:chromate reductase, NAD(P)H dehydrogenase (quinone)